MKKVLLGYLMQSMIISSAYAQVKRDTLRGSHGSYEIKAAFPGGEEGWKSYLERNFRVSEVECEMPAQEATYAETAVIQFKILKNGKVAEVICRNSNLINSALKNEAIRLVRDAPIWTPAENNGRLINDFRIERISIKVPLVSL